MHMPNGNRLAEIEEFVDALHMHLWPINSYIHSNPELAFQEYKARDALTSFMEMQEGWHVTRSAYGMETAWVAAYSSGRPGPVVAFNAEMGTLVVSWHSARRIYTNSTQTHCRAWATHVAIILLLWPL